MAAEGLRETHKELRVHEDGDLEARVSKHDTGQHAAKAQRHQSVLFLTLAVGSIASAVGFSYLQEQVFRTPGFVYGGWMTFLTYVTYTLCGWLEGAVTRSLTRHAAMKDFFIVSILAMAGAFFTNRALLYLNYTTRIVFKSCRVLPVMGFRTLVVGTRYTLGQYVAGGLLVAGITLFTMGDADKHSKFHWTGIVLITIALVCDALTANLEEKQFFRIKAPCTHAEVMLYLSAFAALESFVLIYSSGELTKAMEHANQYPTVVPSICAFSVLGYITVCLILTIIKIFGATNAEIVKSMRKVCQVLLSFWAFPKPFSWKYIVGGFLVTVALYWLQKGKKSAQQESEGKLLAVQGGPVKPAATQAPR